MVTQQEHLAQCRKTSPEFAEHKWRFKQHLGLAEGPLVKDIELVLDLYSVRCPGTGVLELAESRAACFAPHSGTMC